ncbi:hypothetical protein BJP40_16220 [Streptomyces sp. CC53]|nr:hypothetical protein BJP40_16220 [Streptomyces sp. CC53]
MEGASGRLLWRVTPRAPLRAGAVGTLSVDSVDSVRAHRCAAAVRGPAPAVARMRSAGAVGYRPRWRHLRSGLGSPLVPSPLRMAALLAGPRVELNLLQLLQRDLSCLFIVL